MRLLDLFNTLAKDTMIKIVKVETRDIRTYYEGSLSNVPFYLIGIPLVDYRVKVVKIMTNIAKDPYAVIEVSLKTDSEKIVGM